MRRLILRGLPGRFTAAIYLVALIALTITHGSSVAAAEKADLVLTDTVVITMDPRQPRAEAVACKDGRIVAVGSAAAMHDWIGDDTKVLSLDGRYVSPGFIEGHAHYVSLGHAKMILDLTKAKTWDEVETMVAEAAKKTPSGAWILGRGWHQSKWSSPPKPNVDGYPVHNTLSERTPRNPVLLTHASGHMAFANGFAMRLSGITAATPDPAGGEILRSPDGQPTGVFRETAQSLLAEPTTSGNPETQFATAMKLAADECLRNGVTSFQDAGSSFGLIDAFRQYEQQQQLRVRLWVMVRDSNDQLRRNLAAYRQVKPKGFLTVRAVKRSLDGALGPHGAWLIEPYRDLPDSTGLRTLSLGALQQTAAIASANDYQLCVHAIGDRANRETLDLFEEMLSERSTSPDAFRWRVEHAQHLHPTDIPRFAKLGVIASMQGIHCTSDAPFVVERLGKKRAKEGAYVWQSLLRTGAVVINGTDAPVEDIDPLASFYASVTRKLPNGEVFFPEQRMTRAQALRSYTIDAAYAAFEEEAKGSITVGKLADLVVLSHDLLRCTDEEILETQVEYTIVDGKIAYPFPE